MNRLKLIMYGQARSHRLLGAREGKMAQKEEMPELRIFQLLVVVAMDPRHDDVKFKRKRKYDVFSLLNNHEP